MRVPVSWLRRLVPNALSSKDIAEVLTIAGIEVEILQGIGAYDAQVVCGVLLEKQQIPEHPQVWLLQLDVGKSVSVVTTASDAAELVLGTRLAVALAGASLLDYDETRFQLKEVKADKRYGHMSSAVLCSAHEVGVGECSDTFLRLSDSAVAGQAIRDDLSIADDAFADEVMELAILANISRCQSMLGVAREMSALADLTLAPLPLLTALPEDINGVAPSIVATDICRRISLARVHGVHIAPSPLWMQRELALAGVRPINNVVDAGNYVMLEMGQPMHAYDAKKLSTTDLSVGLSQAGDCLHTLAQEETEEALLLKGGHPVIIAKDRIVALAGVIGGSETAVGDDTTELLLEAANFDFIAVRRSQADNKIFTEASSRFSRGVDPTITLTAIQRFVALLQQTCTDLQVVALGDEKNFSSKPRAVTLSCQQVSDTLGLTLSADKMASLLEKVGIDSIVHDEKQSLCAQIGLQREDITEACDLLEEIARLYGYDKLPATMPMQPIPEHLSQPELLAREKLRDACVASGLQEVLSYTMTTPEIEARLQAANAADATTPAYVAVLNSISEERTVLRRSLLPSLLQHIQFNLRFTDACHLFEIGRVFLPEMKSDSPLLPGEPYRLTAVMTGAVQTATWHDNKPREADYYDMANIVQHLFAHLHISQVELEPAQHDLFRPGSCARIIQAGKCYGYLGVVHDLVTRSFALEAQTVIALELDVDAVLVDYTNTFQVQPVTRYPSIDLDISVEVAESITTQWLLSLIKKQGGEFLQDVQVFDIYRSAQLGEGKKAMALRLVFNAHTRTLTMDEACAVRDAIVTELAQEVGAKLRD